MEVYWRYLVLILLLVISPFSRAANQCTPFFPEPAQTWIAAGNVSGDDGRLQMTGTSKITGSSSDELNLTSLMKMKVRPIAIVVITAHVQSVD